MSFKYLIKDTCIIKDKNIIGYNKVIADNPVKAIKKLLNSLYRIDMIDVDKCVTLTFTCEDGHTHYSIEYYSDNEGNYSLDSRYKFHRLLSIIKEDEIKEDIRLKKALQLIKRKGK